MPRAFVRSRKNFYQTDFNHNMRALQFSEYHNLPLLASNVDFPSEHMEVLSAACLISLERVICRDLIRLFCSTTDLRSARRLILGGSPYRSHRRHT